MPHIAFVVAPLSGRVNPTLGVVSELVARGHRVSYAVTGRHAAAAEAAGAACVLYRSTWQQPGTSGSAGGSAAFGARFTADDFVRAQRGQLVETAATLPVISEAYAKDVPDLLVYDPMSWTGQILADTWDVPSVKSVTTLVGTLGEDYAEFDPGHPGLPRLFATMARFLREAGSRLTPDQLFLPSDKTPVIAYHPRAFQVSPDALGDHIHYVGPCLTRRPRAADDAPLVLISLGTLFNGRPELFLACVQALAGQADQVGVRIVVSLGGGMPPAALGDLPPTVEVHAYVDLLTVLPRATVFVSHAGMRSLMESLHHGVPVVTIPQMPEQRANADQLVRLGVGARLDEGSVESDLPEAVATLSADPAVRANVRLMQRAIDEAGGAPAAADVIESLL
jgi:demethyllactenocin mycarosyltransferase